MFRNIPIEEAKASLHVQPNEKDISGATKEDPANCMYARCLRRVLDAPNVYVFKTIAYIQTLNEKGEPRMRRYMVKSYARERLIQFDHGQKVPPGGFVFHRPNRSCTLSYKQKDYAKRAMRAQGDPSPRKSPGKKPNVKNYSLRNGKGCVHLFGTEDQISPRHG